MLFRSPGTRQPAAGAAGASEGGLTAGLRYVYNGAAGVAARATNIGAPVLGQGQFGAGPALNGSSQSVNTGQKFTYTQGTMLLLTAGAVGSVSSSCMACQSSDDGGSGIGLGWQGASFEVNGNSAVLAGSTGPVTGDHCFVGTWGPAGINGYLDGALIATNAYTGAPQAPAGDYNFEIGCFRYSGGRVFFQQHTPALFAVWDRQLSPAEVAAITLTPWRLLPPRRRRLWVGPAAGGSSYSVSITESATATETAAAGLAAAAAIAESATASESTTAALAAGASLTETAAASEAVSAATMDIAAVTEAATASDAVSATEAATAALTEAATAADACDAVVIAAAAVTEAASATEASNWAGNVYSAAVTEAATAGDLLLATLIAGAALTETSAAIDAATGALVAVATIAEAASATAVQTAVGGGTGPTWRASAARTAGTSTAGRRPPNVNTRRRS